MVLLIGTDGTAVTKDHMLNTSMPEVTPGTTAGFPIIASLGLDETELAALSCQGFVSSERRGGRTYYKVRYRRNRRQCVKYLGRDPEKAAAVRHELAQLQADAHRWRRLSRLERETRRALRAAKRQLRPLLNGTGWEFHGLAAIRQRRAEKRL